MAGHKYGSTNPFAAETTPPSELSGKNIEDDYEDFHDEESHLRQLRARMNMLEERQIEATQRSLAVIAETQDIGNATARELLTQGEKLQSTEKKLDTIEYMTKLTQRHITGIKSVFGSFKNWVRGSKDMPAEPAERPAAAPSSRLASLVAADQATDSRPADMTRSRSAPGAAAVTRPPIGEEADDDDYWRSSGAARGRDPWAASKESGATQFGSKSTSVTASSSSSRLDDNLDLIAGGVKQLKDLAIGLGDEIEKQNETIDRLKVKADRVDLTLNSQTSQIRKLL